MIIYAAFSNTVVWSDNKRIHKAGKVPLHEPLTVISEYAQHWYRIERPTNITLAENPSYPNYWIYGDQILEELPGDPDPNPEPEPGTISDADAAAALILFLKWWKQG